MDTKKLKTKEGKVVERIVIMGQGPGFDKCTNEGVDEVWTLNMALFKTKRVDRLFIMDPIETKTDIARGWYHGYFEDHGKKVPVTIQDYKNKVAELDIPFISAHKYEDIKTYEPYPIEEICETFKVDYFANTISYMIAYAILHRVKYIEFWGVNQAAASEFVFHKGCIEFWIGIAVGLGIGVKIEGANSQVLRNPDGLLYGYRAPSEFLIKKLKEKGEITYKPLEKRKKSVVSI